jgi:hypothetical protein
MSEGVTFQEIDDTVQKAMYAHFCIQNIPYRTISY